ncbi:MAG: N-acetylmuramoyl-L-alanine amidase [Bdellovibrionales bacterium]|nr:N-acetylmuramoyl-L-alanine amidase [Bdellovibrionales bacterium]
MKLALVVGHTDLNEGAACQIPFSFLTEYKFNSVLAAQIKMLARERNVICGVFHRDLIGIAKCYKKIEEDFRADYIIELHFNYFKNPEVRGTETLYGNNPLADLLAACVHSQVLAAMDRDVKHDRGIKKITEGGRGYLSLNAATDIPTVIVEPFFGSNLEDVRYALENMNVLADAILEGALLADNPELHRTLATQ